MEAYSSIHEIPHVRWPMCRTLGQPEAELSCISMTYTINITYHGSWLLVDLEEAICRVCKA